MLYFRALLFTIAVLVIVSGCKSQSQMTAREVGCNTRDVLIIDSEFKRKGSTTRWCARCEGRFYQCVTNPRRDHIECRRVEAGPPCK